jgi:membrane protein required for colicin V production
MGIIDWLILVILLAFTLVGLKKGLVATLVQVGGALAAFFLVGHFYPLLRNSMVAKYEMHGTLATLIAVLLIVAAIAVVVRLVIWILNALLKALHLGIFNRFLGTIFGFVNGLLLVMVIMAALDFLPGLSTPLKDPKQHRVYAGVDLLKEELFDKANLKQRKLYHQLKERIKPEKEAIPRQK